MSDWNVGDQLVCSSTTLSPLSRWWFPLTLHLLQTFFPQPPSRKGKRIESIPLQWRFCGSWCFFSGDHPAALRVETSLSKSSFHEPRESRSSGFEFEIRLRCRDSRALWCGWQAFVRCLRRKLSMATFSTCSKWRGAAKWYFEPVMYHGRLSRMCMNVVTIIIIIIIIIIVIIISIIIIINDY